MTQTTTGTPLAELVKQRSTLISNHAWATWQERHVAVAEINSVLKRTDEMIAELLKGIVNDEVN